MYEGAKEEIISVFSEAGKGISDWLEYLDRADIEKLLEAAAIVKNMKAVAIRMQKSRDQMTTKLSK